MEAGAASALRSVVHDALAKHMYDTAAFFADKLVTARGCTPADVYALAHAFFCARQFRRCLQLLRATELLDRDPRFKYLAARCLAECREWEECLTVLGGLDVEEPEELRAALPRASPPGTSNISYFSVFALLRGRVHDALENAPRAVKWYRAALVADPFNYDAFQCLVGGHKLSNAEELELVGSLEVPPEHAWLKLLYTSRCKKYQQGESIEGTLAALEGEPPAEPEAMQQSQQSELGEQQQAGQAGQQQAEQALRDSRSFSQGGVGRGMSGVGHSFTEGGGGGGSEGEAMHTPGGGGGGPQPMALSPLPGAPRTVGTAAGSAGCAATTPGGGGGGEAGWGLAENLDVIACRADWLYHRGAYAECYALTAAALERDPYATECLPVHLASALELRKKNELFLRGHKLVEEHPERAVSWFAVGCYYMAAQQYEQARRYFGKSTALDPAFAPAWVAFGHAFAAQDESDQAMAAYRTAHRRFPGLHAPLVGMGQEYQRMNNLGLAEQCFSQAAKLCPSDPLVAHELGVLAYRNRQYAAAASWLRRALSLVPGGRPTPTWEPSLVNLGHTLRKLRQWDAATECYQAALGLKPGQAGTCAALGYTYHLKGEVDAAVEHYHKALGLRPEDAFTAEMLAEAMEESSAAFEQQLREQQAAGEA